MAKPIAYAARLQKEPFTITQEQMSAAKERYTKAKKLARQKKEK